MESLSLWYVKQCTNAYVSEPQSQKGVSASRNCYMNILGWSSPSLKCVMYLTFFGI